MKTAAYILSSITFATCAALLFRGYLSSRQRLLLWSSLCFFGLGLSNLLVFVDLVLLPDIDLYILRLSTAAISMCVLIAGLLGGGVKPNLEGFLLGVVATCSLMAGLFFLKYWRRTRDYLFLAFSAAFLIEGVNRAAYLTLDEPNHGSWVIYFVRLCASLLILIAIIRKNYGLGSANSRPASRTDDQIRGS